MWALVSPDGVAPSRMVCVSTSVNLPLHHKVQKFSSGTGSPGWSQKKGCKTVVVLSRTCLIWYSHIQTGMTWVKWRRIIQYNGLNTEAPHHNRFTDLFSGPPGWSGARRELLDFTVQGNINRGRHTDHPAGRHSTWTNQCPPPPSPIFYRLDALPAAQPSVSKHWRQLAHSD